MNFQETVAANRAILAQAQALNIRAGTNVFPVPGREELLRRFTAGLNGARRVAEIRDLTALMLPVLEERLVEQVLREQPDTITVLGREVAVEYRAGYAPRVRIDFRGDESRDWLNLPDDGIKLPGGREVSMYSSVEGYGYYIETSSSQFKAKVRECLNQGLWDNWQQPDLPPPSDLIPPIAEMEYGRCVVTGVALFAFGVFKYDSWYENPWKPYWTRDRAEAERLHAQACEKLVEACEKAARETLKKRVGELYGEHRGNHDLPEEMRTRMYNTYYGYSSGATTIAELEQLIVQVEAEIAAAVERKAKAERERIEAERKKREAEEVRLAEKAASNSPFAALAALRDKFRKK